MQEEKTTGPHSYLAGYLAFIAAALIALAALIFFGVKRFSGEQKLETCETRLDRLGKAVQAYSRANEGIYPEKLESVVGKDDTRCPLGRDPGENAAHYEYQAGPSSFSIECKLRAHLDVLGKPPPKFQSD